MQNINSLLMYTVHSFSRRLASVVYLRRANAIINIKGSQLMRLPLSTLRKTWGLTFFAFFYESLNGFTLYKKQKLLYLAMWEWKQVTYQTRNKKSPFFRFPFSWSTQTDAVLEHSPWRCHFEKQNFSSKKTSTNSQVYFPSSRFPCFFVSFQMVGTFD